MEIKVKTVVAIGLLGLCIPFAIIQSRRGVSENRVNGQMDSDVAVNLPGVGTKKKPKTENVVDASGLPQSPPEFSDFAPEVGSDLRVTAMSATGVAHNFGVQGSLLHTNSSINQTNQSKSAPQEESQEESLEDKDLEAATREVNLDMVREKLRTTMQTWISSWLTGDFYCVKPDQVAEAKVVKTKMDELASMVGEYKKFLKGPKATSKEALDKSKKMMDKVNNFQYCESALQAKCYFLNKQNCTENTPPVHKDLMAVFEGSGDKKNSMPTILLEASLMSAMAMKHSTQWDDWSAKSGCQMDLSNSTFVAWAKDFGCTDNCKDPILNQASLPATPPETQKDCADLLVPGSGNWKMGCWHGTTKCDKSESYPACCCKKGKFFTKDFSATGCKAKCSKTPASDIQFHWYTQQRLKLVLDKIFNLPGKECDYRAKYQASSIGTKRLNKGVWLQLGKLLRALFEKRLFSSAANGVKSMVDNLADGTAAATDVMAETADNPQSLLELADMLEAGEDSEIGVGLLVLIIFAGIVGTIITILIITWIVRNFDDILAVGLFGVLFMDD